MKKFEKRKVHLSFKDNTWETDLAIKLTSKYYKGL